MHREIKPQFFLAPLYVLIGLFTLALCHTALGQAEPAFPGSIEYSLTSSNYTWFRTSDTITNGVYVEDLIADIRLNQPAGRGRIGIVTDTSFDGPPYNQMAATVDFGNNYLVGIVFSELSAVHIVAVPEPSALLALVPGALLWRGILNQRRRSKASA